MRKINLRFFPVLIGSQGWRVVWMASRAWVDSGPMLKRIQPAPQGRAHRILKRTSHVTVVVSAGDGGPAK